MTTEQSSEAEQKHDSGDAVKSSVGDRLKKQREHLKISQEDIATKLNLNVSYIAAIESNEYDKIAGKSFIYGYIRSYARILKLPEQEIVDIYHQDNEQQSNLVPNYMEHKIAFTTKSFRNKFGGLLILGVIGLLIVVWWFIRQ